MSGGGLPRGVLADAGLHPSVEGGLEKKRPAPSPRSRSRGPILGELSVLLRASRFRRRLRRARVMIVARVLLPRPYAHGLLSLRAAAGDEEGLLPTHPGRRVPASH